VCEQLTSSLARAASDKSERATKNSLATSAARKFMCPMLHFLSQKKRCGVHPINGI